MRRGCGGCAGSLFFFLIFFTVGGGLLYWGWTILQNARASASWPSAQGQIVNSYVSHSTDSEGGDSYSPEVTFEYTVNDQRYQDTRIKFGENSYSSNNRAQEVVNRYPIGQTVAVYYDPAEPETAVLEPGVTSGSYIVIGIGAIFVLVSLVVAPIVALAGRRR
jgi:hypothetical protein